MGSVHKFEKPGKTPQKSSWDMLHEAVNDSKVQEAVQNEMDRTFSRTKNERGRLVVRIPKLGMDQQERRGGTMSPVPNERDLIVTSGKFPEYLMEEGLSEEKAFHLGATSVLAYNTVHVWTQGLMRHQRDTLRREVRRPVMQPQHPSLWLGTEFSLERGIQSGHMVTHRCAARIALNASGVADFDSSMPLPLPLHIAALADPLSTKQVGELHDLVSISY